MCSSDLDGRVEFTGDEWRAGKRLSDAALQQLLALVGALGAQKGTDRLPSVPYLDQAVIELPAPAAVRLHLSWEHDHGLVSVWGPGDAYTNQTLVALVNQL